MGVHEEVVGGHQAFNEVIKLLKTFKTVFGGIAKSVCKNSGNIVNEKKKSGKVKATHLANR